MSFVSARFFFFVCVGFRIMFTLVSFVHGHGSVSLRLERSSVRCWCEIDFADFLRVCAQAFSVLVLQFVSVALPVLGLRRVCVYSRCPASSKNWRRRQPQQMSLTMHCKYRGLWQLQRFRGLHLVSCLKLENGGERFECLWGWLEAEIKDTVLTIDVSVLYFVDILLFYAKVTKAVNETGVFLDGGNLQYIYIYVK